MTTINPDTFLEDLRNSASQPSQTVDPNLFLSGLQRSVRQTMRGPEAQANRSRKKKVREIARWIASQPDRSEASRRAAVLLNSDSKLASELGELGRQELVQHLAVAAGDKRRRDSLGAGGTISEGFSEGIRDLQRGMGTSRVSGLGEDVPGEARTIPGDPNYAGYHKYDPFSVGPDVQAGKTDLFDTEVDSPESRYWRKLSAAIDFGDPITDDETSTLLDWTAKAARMTPGMAAGISAIAGGTAVGGPGVGTYAGWAAWYNMAYPQTYDTFRDAGMSDKEAKVAGRLSAAIESGIEVALAKVPGLDAWKGRFAGEGAREFAKKYIKDVGYEVLEEGLQDATRSGVLNVVSAFDEKVGAPGLKEALLSSASTMYESAGPIGVMMAPGAVGGAKFRSGLSPVELAQARAKQKAQDDADVAALEADLEARKAPPFEAAIEDAIGRQAAIAEGRQDETAVRRSLEDDVTKRQIAIDRDVELVDTWEAAVEAAAKKEPIPLGPFESAIKDAEMRQADIEQGRKDESAVRRAIEEDAAAAHLAIDEAVAKKQQAFDKEARIADTWEAALEQAAQRGADAAAPKTADKSATPAEQAAPIDETHVPGGPVTVAEANRPDVQERLIRENPDAIQRIISKTTPNEADFAGLVEDGMSESEMEYLSRTLKRRLGRDRGPLQFMRHELQLQATLEQLVEEAPGIAAGIAVSRKASRREFASILAPDTRLSQKERLSIAKRLRDLTGLKKGDLPDKPTGSEIKTLAHKATEHGNALIDSAIRDLEKLYGDGNTLYSNPLRVFDPRISKPIAKLLAGYIAKGAGHAMSFSQAVLDAAARLPRFMQSPNVHEVFEAEWNRLASDNPQMGKAGKVADVLAKVAGERKYEPVGREDVANPGRGPEESQIFDQATEQLGRPTPVAQAGVRAEAKRQFEADPEGVRASYLANVEEVKDRGGLNTEIGKEIFNADARAAIQDESRIDAAIESGTSYSLEGTEIARLLNNRKNPQTWLEEPGKLPTFVLSQIFEMPKSLAEKIKRAEAGGRMKRGQRLRDQWKRTVERTLRDLRKNGYDASKFGEMSLQDARRVLNIVSAARAPYLDKAHEFFTNFLVSGPHTQVVNAITAPLHAGYHFTARKLVDAAFGKVTGIKESAKFGEYRYILGAAWPGLANAAQFGWKTFKSEAPEFDMSMGEWGSFRFQDDIRGPKMRGWPGRLIRTFGFRPLAAIDQFWTASFYEMERAGQAYRQAVNEGFSGKDREALEQRMAELLSDPKSKPNQKAYETALNLVFRDKPTRALQKVLDLRHDIPSARWFVIFVSTPWNITKTGVGISPLGAVKRLPEAVWKGVSEGDWSKMTPAMAEAALSWMAVLALIGDDDDDPIVTGSQPTSPHAKGERAMQYRTFPAYSIRVPFTENTRLDYSRAGEPVAIGLSMAADIAKHIRQGTPGKIPMASWQNLVSKFKNTPMIAGMSDLYSVIEDPENKGTRWASNFAAAWVPNLYRSSVRTQAEHYPNRRVWGKGGEKLRRMLKRTVQRTELGIIPDEPLYDLWGRSVERESGPSPNSDFFWRMLSPVKIYRPQIFDGDRALLNWNLLNPDDKEAPEMPDPYYTIDGERHYMTDEQYSDFARISGQLSAARVTARNINVSEPAERDIKVIKDSLSRSRREIKRKLIREWQGERQVGLTDQETKSKIDWLVDR